MSSSFVAVTFPWVKPVPIGCSTQTMLVKLFQAQVFWTGRYVLGDISDTERQSSMQIGDRWLFSIPNERLTHIATKPVHSLGRNLPNYYSQDHHLTRWEFPFQLQDWLMGRTRNRVDHHHYCRWCSSTQHMILPGQNQHMALLYHWQRILVKSMRYILILRTHSQF